MLIIEWWPVFLLWSWRSTNRGILATVPECIVRTSQCSRSVSPMFVPLFKTFKELLPSYSPSISTPLPPAGLSDIPGEAMVKLYCPKCMDVYTPKSSRHHHTDGAYFGTGFPHMLFMVHPEYRPKRPANQFVPRCVYLSGLHFQPHGSPPCDALW